MALKDRRGMPRHFTLRSRIVAMITGLIVVTISGAFVLVWYTHRTDDILGSLINREITAFQTAEELEKALINQKGFLSYYFLDGDPEWIKQLGEYRQIFKDRLDQANSRASSEEEREKIKTIEKDYFFYVELKDRLLSLHKKADPGYTSELHKEVRSQFMEVLKRCDEFKGLHRQMISKTWEQSILLARTLRAAAFSAITLVILLGLILAFFIIRQILDPLKRLTLATNPKGSSGGDEVKALSTSVQGLMRDMDKTHLELARSRETLLQSEKMALIGKLAAGTAHSIRNPLTSVKMRLFSLGRALSLNTDQKEDFQVISEEIRHIDNIVQNFLEFSRPPKLKTQMITPSEVVDLTIQLMRHRLTNYEVDVILERDGTLPQVSADPEQLKEVMVNILVNACEAMERGGIIRIKEEEKDDPERGRTAVIKISDNGPGIPAALQDKVLQPFFTTKEQGTGLGLSIAARIVEQHGGWLDIISTEGKGTTFVISLPVKEFVQ